MKALTHFSFVSALCILCLIAFSCDGHEELYFTQTQVLVDGPCLTGAPRKEVPLPNNTLTLVLGSSDFVNIHGGSGNYTVTSDRKGVEVEITPNVKNQIFVQSTQYTSQACINVTDDDGNLGSFIVDVYKDYIYELDETGDRTIACRVEGVSIADSAAIASAAIQNNQDARFIIRNFDLEWRPTSRSSDDVIAPLYPITIQNNRQETIMKGQLFPTWRYEWLENIWWTWMMDINVDEEYRKNEYGYGINYYYVDNEEGKWFVKDLTDEYIEQYKDVTSVCFWIPVRMY